jgi:hypothetical protein
MAIASAIAYDVIDWLAIGGGVLSLAALIWVAARGDPAREEEDAARAFFDVHGHWPDE